MGMNFSVAPRFFFLIVKKTRKGVCVGEKEETFIKLNNFQALLCSGCT